MQQKYIVGSLSSGTQVSSGSSTGQPHPGFLKATPHDFGSQLNKKLSYIPHSTASKQVSLEKKHEVACRLAIQLATPTGILITMDC
jgi:hypothetical protein